LKQATFSFAPYDLLERVVGYLLDEVLMPSTGAAGDAVIGRIDGGIAWLCARWGERLGTAEADGTFQTPTMPAQEVPATAGALMSSGTTNGPPPSSPVTGEASRLLALLHATASGESPDAAGVRNYIHQLRDHLQNSNTTLSPKENKRFLDILCDTRFLGQITGAAGRDPYVLLADIEDALAKSPVDKSVVEGRVRSLCDVLADARVKLQPERVEKTIKALRRGRLPDLIALLADRVLTREPDAALLGRIGPHYALSLIDGQKIVAGIEVLHAVLERGQLTAEVNAEVLGGLGRAHKQIYVNHVKSVSDALALEPTHGQQLTRAIDYYSRLYDPGKPNENAWHGINLVALLKRAEADRLRLGTRHDAHALAQGMIGAIEPRNSNTDDHYALATLGEAYLALDEIEKAARFYAAFANHPATDAFALNSAVRQLEEVWRLQASKDGAGTLLVGLKAALAQKEGGRITLSSAERQAIAAATTVEHQEQFESRTQGGKFVPLEYLKRVVFTGMAVAAVKQRSDLGGKHTTGAGETIGTGFLIDAATLGLPSGSSYLLTNAHVLWDPDKGQGLENSALPPAQAAIVFEGADGHGGVFSCSKIHWQSPSGLHDAALVELDRVVEGIKPLVFASGEMKLDIDDGGGKKGTRLAVVGHPEGGALSVGLTGSLEDISARLVDKGPKGNSQDPTYLH
ncbi:MAG: tetratricopeptide repeat-containing protein, partial [Hyphomicrobium sp.]